MSADLAECTPCDFGGPDCEMILMAIAIEQTHRPTVRQASSSAFRLPAATQKSKIRIQMGAGLCELDGLPPLCGPHCYRSWSHNPEVPITAPARFLYKRNPQAAAWRRKWSQSPVLPWAQRAYD